MLKTDLILRNPIQFLGGQSEDVMASGQFGGVLARAGVGKTALMVQMALNAMLHERNVLHVSLNGETEWGGTWNRHVRPSLLNYRAQSSWLPHLAVAQRRHRLGLIGPGLRTVIGGCPQRSAACTEVRRTRQAGATSRGSSAMESMTASGSARRMSWPWL